ncbi:hypothetical protein FRX31_023326 [Thalictrum thalictroides]|uniref:Uncharacterized protein n=1 Tax=Thalictrum thalictroides TaxID=46969 RepID=A0A7J6VR79_THATH|nr:hypothetical protein FRX31_023326 [Thalictrum thalictroides]
MEPCVKLSGLIKGISFNKSSKSSSSMKAKPSTSSSNASAATSFHFEKEFAIPPPMHKVSLVKSGGGCDLTGLVDDRHGDETVDVRAASYISYVRERFKLERVKSNRQ